MRLLTKANLICLCLVSLWYWPPCAWPEDTVHTEVVQTQTVDGITLDGVLRHPELTRIRGAVLMVHGYGGNFYSGIMSFLPEALATRDFATLALNMRDHDRGPKRNRFEENRQDIAAGVDEMARRGYTSLFLYGHSMGTNRVLYYLAETKDPRVMGAILTGPPGNLFQWNVRTFGLETATRVLHQAQTLVAEGKGHQWMLIDLGPLGKTLYTANHVVSLRGPESHSDPFKNITRVSKPILIVHGLADRLADPKVADQLEKRAKNLTQVRLSKIPGADHRFRGCEKILVETISQWLVGQLGR